MAALAGKGAAAGVMVAGRTWKRMAAALAASDPAFGRLRMGARVTLTLLLMVGALAALHRVLPLPYAAYGMAIITAMQGAIQIRDATSLERLRTRIYGGAAGFVAVAAAAVLAPWPIAVDLLFLALVFAAVYARKYGVRWNAVGMFAFMSYFMGAYLHPTPADLPGIALAIVVSGAIAHLVRNLVLPERPGDEFARAVLALTERIDDFASLLPAGTAAKWPLARRREARRQLAGVSEALLIAEGYLAPAAGPAAGEDPAAELAVLVFNLQLACETALFHAFDGAQVEAVRRSAVQLRERAAEVRRQADALPEDALTRPSAAPPEAPAAPGIRSLGDDPAFRLAVQVTLASAIAMTGGQMLSKTRWFWAILTAFLVFINTQSRGDTVLRAVHRTLGTLAGIVAGIALATLLNGLFWLPVLLIVAFTFTGFYLLQISYAALTFFVTLVLSLLYGLIGQFTPELLILRLEETLIGVGAGLFIAFVVYPQRTTDAGDRRSEGFFAALDKLLAAAEEEKPKNLILLSRLVDRRYGELVAVVRPLGSRWQIVRRPGPVRRVLLRFLAASYWARNFARAMTETPPSDREALLAAIAGCRARIADLRRKGTHFFDEGGGTQPPMLPPDEFHRVREPIYALHVLALVLDRLTRQDGAKEA